MRQPSPALSGRSAGIPGWYRIRVGGETAAWGSVGVRRKTRGRDGGVRKELAAGMKKRRVYQPRVFDGRIITSDEIEGIHKEVPKFERIEAPTPSARPRNVLIDRL
jgi:hypothetical protein